MFPAFNGTIVSLFSAHEAATDPILSQINAVHNSASSVIMLSSILCLGLSYVASSLQTFQPNPMHIFSLKCYIPSPFPPCQYWTCSIWLLFCILLILVELWNEDIFIGSYDSTSSMTGTVLKHCLKKRTVRYCRSFHNCTGILSCQSMVTCCSRRLLATWKM